MSSPDTRYWYIEDALCKHRVLTVARRKVDGMIYMTWCLNRVQIENSDRMTQDRVRVIVSRTYIDDAFNKHVARRICNGRLDVGRAICVLAPLEATTHSYLKIMYDEMLKPWPQWEWVSDRYAHRSYTEGPALPKVAAILKRSVHDR